MWNMSPFPCTHIVTRANEGGDDFDFEGESASSGQYRFSDFFQKVRRGQILAKE